MCMDWGSCVFWVCSTRVQECTLGGGAVPSVAPPVLAIIPPFPSPTPHHPHTAKRRDAYLDVGCVFFFWREERADSARGWVRGAETQWVCVVVYVVFVACVCVCRDGVQIGERAGRGNEIT